jgi:hypothetical protein
MTMSFGKVVPSLGLLFMIAGCGTSNGSSTSNAGHSGAAGGGGSMGGATAAGAGGSTSGGGGLTATGGGGMMATGAGGMMGGPGKGPAGQGGAIGVVNCTPGVQSTLITDCGYPMTGGSALSQVTFSENEVLRAIQPEGAAPQGIVRLFYSDEHALTLGVRNVVVKTAAGATTMDYAVSPLTTDPGSVTNAQLGTTELRGDQSGLDQSLRPMWPVLYITDITTNPQSRVGDWQEGGVPTGPNAVFGTWKAAARTVDKTVTPNTVVITPDKDPVKNNWNLGGGDPVPAGLTNQGYGAEARWTVPLASGHSYRVQVLVHDGDQNKAGGDSGEACVLFCSGSGGGTGGTGGEPPGPPAMCPTGVAACGLGGIDPASCPAGTVCANGCCLTSIIVM